MTFKAEIQKTESKKLITNDIQYKVTLITNDSNILDLGKISADTICNVSIEPEGDELSFSL